MTTSAPAVVSLDGITCRYGDVLAVDQVTLQLPAGVLVGFVGPSGSQVEPAWEIDALGLVVLVFSLLSWRLVRHTISRA